METPPAVCTQVNKSLITTHESDRTRESLFFYTGDGTFSEFSENQYSETLPGSGPWTRNKFTVNNLVGVVAKE